MSRLIRMDRTGHTELASWTVDDDAAFAAAAASLDVELAAGMFAVATRCDGTAEQVRTLPRDSELVVLRRPIAGG